MSNESNKQYKMKVTKRGLYERYLRRFGVAFNRLICVTMTFSTS